VVYLVVQIVVTAPEIEDCPSVQCTSSLLIEQIPCLHLGYVMYKQEACVVYEVIAYVYIHMCSGVYSSRTVCMHMAHMHPLTAGVLYVHRA